MISYIDDFKLMMIVTLCAIPLAFLLRKPQGSARCGGARRRAHGLTAGIGQLAKSAGSKARWRFP